MIDVTMLLMVADADPPEPPPPENVIVGADEYPAPGDSINDIVYSSIVQ